MPKWVLEPIRFILPELASGEGVERSREVDICSLQQQRHRRK